MRNIIANLLVDVGNSRIKVAAEISNDIKLIYNVAYAKKSTLEISQEILAKTKDFMVENIYLASVVSQENTQQIVDKLNSTFGVQTKIALPTKKTCGLENAYFQFASLGIDRWLSLIAGYTRYDSPLCIVGCGTAVTVDTINDKGIFIGGLIIPGLGLMRDSLYKNTHAIGMHTANEQRSYFAKDTSSAVVSGTALCIAALVDNTIRHYQQTENHKITCILTGGDGHVIQSYMDEPCHYHPNLVLEGLAKYFEHHQ